MPRGILFDLDGTLFDRDAAVRDLVASQHMRFAEALREIPCRAYVERVLELDAHGYRDKTDVFQQVVSDFALPPSLAAALTTDFWDEYHSFCRGFSGVLPVLSELHGRGMKLGVITNGAVRIQEPVILRLGIARLLDVVLISEREGVRKPDREIFERALGALDLRANETWYVGDHPEVDVEGAARAGLSAVWKRTAHWPAPDSRHRQIGELQDLLDLVNAGE